MATSEPNETPSCLIPCLGTVVPLEEFRDPRDDWTGTTSTAERKRRQNRLNQRAYRTRKHAQRDHSSAPTADIGRQREPTTREPRAVTEEYTHGSDGADDTGEGYLLLPWPRRRDKIHTFMREACREHSLNALRPTQLPMLIRLNVLNALSRNAVMLGFPVDGLCHDDRVSPFNEQGPGLGDAAARPSCRRNLQPTAMQVAVRHHPWIDLFPIPRLRDNMLQAILAGLLDEDELCADLLNVEDDRQGEKPSLIVWGASWDPEGWEASVAFLRKWGWLIQGCSELLEATNLWRQKRGVKPLAFELFRDHIGVA